MPDVEASIWQAYKDQGVLVYALHPGDDPQQIADFVTQTGITFPVLNSMGTLGKFDFPPGVGYPYPRDIVIDKQGTVRSIRNSFDVDEMTALIEQLLAE